MAGSMQFDLVSPERSLASVQATEVQIPGADGDMTAMADHAPTLTTLRPGIVVVTAEDGQHEFVVSGGFAEISGKGVSILAEHAYKKADILKSDFDVLVDHAKAKVAAAAGETVDQHQKFLSDLEVLGTHLDM
ncbi:MAG: F0F1 ATP synthase subunit epsilon [Planktomarina sp.]